MAIEKFISKLPKAELHLHLEGTLEPELMFEIANRNNIEIPFTSIEEVRKAYQFSCLQDFLDIYYAGANVLRYKQDFYELTYAYLKRAFNDGVRHVEVFFDPQTHTERGIDFATVIEGIREALDQGKKDFGITSYIIMCFLRHLDQDSAFKTLDSALPYKKDIKAIGLDSSELGNPPEKFADVFKQAKSEGFLAVAHAGEEGTIEYVEDAIHLLDLDRIDHGNRCVESEEVMNVIAQKKLALTMCPLSNLKLKVVDNLKNYPIRELWKADIIATINSDDPAYFGGYINQNYTELAQGISLTQAEVTTLTKASFQASFLPVEMKEAYCKEVEEYANKYRS